MGQRLSYSRPSVRVHAENVKYERNKVKYPRRIPADGRIRTHNEIRNYNEIHTPQSCTQDTDIESLDGFETLGQKMTGGPPVRVILLGCGSYNPITNMHLRMFELARDALNRSGKFRVIGGIISPVNDGYNKKDLVSAKHRCAMVRAALKTSDWIKIDTWECEQDAWQETAKVISHHRKNLDSLCNSFAEDSCDNNMSPSKRRRPNKRRSVRDDRSNSPLHINHNSIYDPNQPVQVKLLCGADMLESFGTPGLWSDEDIELILNEGIVCITRSGTDPEKFIYESDLLTKFENNIYIVREWIPNEISATKIRRSLRRNESVKYLLQDTVIQYIKDHNLYNRDQEK